MPAQDENLTDSQGLGQEVDYPSLAENESLFRDLTEQSPMPIGILNPDGTYRMVNRAFRELWAIDDATLDEALKHFNILKDEQSRALGTLQLVEKAFAGTPVVSEPYRYDAHQALDELGLDTSQGRSRWIRGRLYPVLDRAGTLQNVIHMQEDITAVVEAEEALKRREARFRAIFEHSHDAIFLMDGTEFVECNAKTLELFGCETVAQVLGKTPMDFSPSVQPDGISTAEKAEQMLKLTDRGDVISFEWRHHRLDGTEFDAEVSLSPLEIDGRQYNYAIARDISERKAAEQALHDSQRQYSTVVESTTDGIVIIQDGLVRFVNSASPTLMGYSPEELLGTPFIEHVSPEFRDIVLQRHRARLSGDSLPSIYEISLLRKDKTKLSVELNATQIMYENEPAVLAFLRDITERIESERRIRASLESTIQALAGMIESRDPYTSGHQRRVSQLAVAIAKQLKLPDAQVNGVRVAAMLHDIGKIVVPAEILSKPGKLSSIEFQIIQQHSEAARRILEGIPFDWPIAEIIFQHHERMDGSGYPRGIPKDEILYEARILAVADAVEAMSSHRPYRPALGSEFALNQIRNESGIYFDPEVVSACVQVFETQRFEFEE